MFLKYYFFVYFIFLFVVILCHEQEQQGERTEERMKRNALIAQQRQNIIQRFFGEQKAVPDVKSERSVRSRLMAQFKGKLPPPPPSPRKDPKKPTLVVSANVKSLQEFPYCTAGI